MKSWLRLTLITMTVGGGFTGFVLTFQSLTNSPGQSPINLLIIAVFLAAYAYVTIAGLIFVHDAQRTRPLFVALAIQIPWFSSPIIVYRFAAGLLAVLSVGGPSEAGTFGLKLGANALLGCSFRFQIAQENPWSIGINFFPLVMLVLLRRSSGITPIAPMTTTSSAETTAPADPS